MNAIANLMRPASVAVIGASSDAAKTAGRPIAYLQKHGFQGEIYPVNPRYSSIAGLPCYADVDALPAAPDVGIVLLGADRAHVAVEALARRGTAAAIVLASGYAETGEAGMRRQAQLKAAAGSMRVLGPNTIGVVNLTDGVTLSASGALDTDDFTVGGVSVVSQSGGILGALLSRAADRGMGLSKLVSTSNEVDLDVSDFIDFFVDDAATSVIALYLEGLRDPARFRAAARKAAGAGKPIVVYKIGRSESGAQSAVSHTGALAGEDRMYDALFRDAGVIRANTFGDLLDIPNALASGRSLRGKRVAILTSTGGAGTLVADNLGLAGFDTPAPDPDTAAALRALQTGDHAVLDRNPIDVTLAGLQPDLLRRAIRTLADSSSYDAVAVIAGSSSIGMPDLMAGAVRDALPDTDKPVMAFVSPHAPTVVRAMNRLGVPAFMSPESVSSAMAAMRETGRRRVDVTEAASAAEASTVDVADVPTGPLDEAQAKALFARFGITPARERVVRTCADAEQAARDFDDRVVLKLLSNRITHKSDIGGVAVGLAADEIGARLTRMRCDVETAAGFAPDAFLVQEMVSGGVEMIVGLHRDPLGTAILLGMGGVTAEILNDTVLRMLPTDAPLSLRDASDMIRELRTWPLLDGYRGRPKADVDALAAALVAFSRMALQLGERLVEAEINPLFVLDAGRGVRAADGVAVIA
ncbi:MULTISPECIES: acetate--CoA ligase family protein [Burkholderia]|uniref:acetate--CoA ligase family protein n=1 Tax=Burkholderia TaxID=32008 RepID=UPI00078C19D7|nr:MULTISPECIES: acetate--CoA ligase family protein [Burkholderia]AMU10841.1 6-carboxyhexanoate--CoA ligase [Burkholderia cenocepacia]MBL3964133.1 acetate--CoA ligase family protein [Burkholderia sp. KCJ3K979]MDG0066240.1 acetate--CoA ligase family protein [Burkholderia sp. IO2]RQS26558.1 CoA-binding protein [Burkholderia sp. Bp8995]RQS48566.1 CoA-binding protein [Burkholderia sp. Bp8989]